MVRSAIVHSNQEVLCLYRPLLRLPKKRASTSVACSPQNSKSLFSWRPCAVISVRLSTCFIARLTRPKTTAVTPIGSKTRRRKSASNSLAFMPVTRSVRWRRNTSATACSSVSSTAAKVWWESLRPSRCWCRSSAKPDRSPIRTADSGQSSLPNGSSLMGKLMGLFFCQMKNTDSHRYFSF